MLPSAEGSSVKGSSQNLLENFSVREGEMVPLAEGSSVKGSSQQSWTSIPKVKGGCPLKTL